MSAQYVCDVYYAALDRAYDRAIGDWENPVVQGACIMSAWEAVDRYPETEETTRALRAYQAARADLRSHPEAVQSAWERYVAASERAMRAKHKAGESDDAI